jgi:putative transposase
VLTVQNVGCLKVKQHRFLPAGAKVKQVVLKRQASGWYVFLQLACPDPLQPPLLNGLPAVGGDMGLLRQALAELRRAQRRLARATTGNHRRQDKRHILARRHEHIANQRRDLWHKLTFWLVHTYGLIALENLTLAFMTHNPRLSLSAHDAGLGTFQTLLG